MAPLSGSSQRSATVPATSPGTTPSSQPHLVQRAHLVAGAELAGVDAVVAELVVVEHPVLVADQPVRRHDGGVEHDLGLGVLGGDGQRRREVLDEQPLGLGERVDVGVEAVATVGELLHQVVVVVAHPVADGHEVDALVAGLGDLSGRAPRVGDPDVGDAVGRQHHDVDARRGRTNARACS